MNKVRVAVLGYGHLGKWHCQKVEANSDKAEFVAIVEKFPAGQEAAKTAHPKVKVVDDIKNIINEIDAAFIVTPTSTHFELVKYLLENGKHVFCEKPLCSNDQEGNLLRPIAEAKKLVLQVGHSERFHEAWEILKKDFEALKSPYVVRINRVAAFKGRATDVDVVQDLGIHDLDLLTYLFKDRPIAVKAYGQKIRTLKWDNVTIDLTLENGSRAFITIGRNHVKEIRDLEVISKNGMIYVDLFSNKISLAHHDKFEDGSFVQERTYNKRDHLLVEHQAFYQSILENKPAIIGLKDGLNAVHLVDSVLKSLEENKEVKL
ncbi:MAG: Gfo/Idh/MocA family protein [Bacteriovoracaceae bacterium]